MKRKCGSVLLMLCVCVLLVTCSRQKKEEKLYLEILKSAGEINVRMASACISHARSYIKVMEYARVTGEDLSSVADNILGREYKELQTRLKENKAKIDEFMASLEEPPSSFVEPYQYLVELHSLYSKIHVLALSPSGSAEEYSDSVTTLESWLKELKHKLDAFLEE
jgi:hypothetical protein